MQRVRLSSLPVNLSAARDELDHRENLGRLRSRRRFDLIETLGAFAALACVFGVLAVTYLFRLGE